MQQMKFGELTFPYNPASVKLSFTKHIVPRFSPFSGSVVQNYGKEPRRVTGAGELLGTGAETLFQQIRQAFDSNESSVLELEGESFTAFFEALSCERDAQSRCVRYQFGFVEDAT